MHVYICIYIYHKEYIYIHYLHTCINVYIYTHVWIDSVAEESRLRADLCAAANGVPSSVMLHSRHVFSFVHIYAYICITYIHNMSV